MVLVPACARQEKWVAMSVFFPTGLERDDLALGRARTIFGKILHLLETFRARFSAT
jgi:hypothetical protein